MDQRIEVALHAYVRIYADTYHWRGDFRNHARWVQKAVVDVAAPLLYLSGAELLRATEELSPPPRDLNARQVWIDGATGLLLSLVPTEA